jgi:phage shock protein A
MALWNHKLTQNADPKVLLDQAFSEIRRTHHELTKNAAEVLGNLRHLEIKIADADNKIANIKDSIEECLLLAERATNNETILKANASAQQLANNLVSQEKIREELIKMLAKAEEAAEYARSAVDRNALILQSKMIERTNLMHKLNQAEMQERIATSLRSVSEINAPESIESLEVIKERIDRKYSNSLGATELAESSLEGQTLSIEQAVRTAEGSRRLEEIRNTMTNRLENNNDTGNQ